MIISRSPLRISLGGGGTDLPSYYKKRGGFLISGAINKYVYISVAPTFNKKFILKYSRLEAADNIKRISHPIFREIFNYFKIKKGINVSSHADVPAGTGLGSSGAFTVGVIRAILKLYEKKLTKRQIAELAFYIENNKLKEPVGKQDQYASAFGGINSYNFTSKGVVKVKKLNISRQVTKQFCNNLLLFFTGYTRKSYKILKDQNNKTKKLDKEMIKNLDQIKEFGQISKEVIEKKKFSQYGLILDEHWKLKKKRSSSISNKKIDYLYDFAKDNGALGGKIIGAGGGGFFLFYTEKPKYLKKKLEKKLDFMNFDFDYEGSKILTE